MKEVNDLLKRFNKIPYGKSNEVFSELEDGKIFGITKACEKQENALRKEIDDKVESLMDIFGYKLAELEMLVEILEFVENKKSAFAQPESMHSNK